MRLLVAPLCLAAVLSLPKAGHAQERPSTIVTKPNVVRAVVGNFGSPTGHLGIEAERTFGSWFALHGGVGAGGVGAQIATGFRLRPVQGERWASQIVLHCWAAAAQAAIFCWLAGVDAGAGVVVPATP